MRADVCYFSSFAFFGNMFPLAKYYAALIICSIFKLIQGVILLMQNNSPSHMAGVACGFSQNCSY